MKQAKDVRDQPVKIMERYRQPIVSCGHDTDRVRRALCAGFFRNAARREREAGPGCYRTVVQGTQVHMHPSSALFGRQAAEWVAPRARPDVARVHALDYERRTKMARRRSADLLQARGDEQQNVGAAQTGADRAAVQQV